MPSLPPRPPHTRLRDIAANPGKPALRDASAMQYQLSFLARVREQVVQGASANEFQKIVALKGSNLATYVVCRRASKVDANGDPSKSTAALSEYPVNSCIKITPWHIVERQGTMAIHFDKEVRATGELKSSRLGDTPKTKPPKSARTKAATVTIRHWPAESAKDVQEFWKVLHSAVKETQQEGPPQQKPRFGRGSSSLRHSLVDPEFRMKERKRLAEEYNRLGKVSRPSVGRLSQGQKMQRALLRGAPQKSSRYTALARGASGEKSFAKSLIGSPDLNGFDEKPKVKRSPPNTERNRHIEEELSKRCGARKLSQPVSPPSPGAVARDRGASRVSPNEGGDFIGATQKHNSRANGNTRIEGKRSGQDSLDVRESRKKFLEQNLALHRKTTSQPALPRRKTMPLPTPSRRKLLPRLASASQPDSTSPDLRMSSTAGIANEGNTCYLSAVLQALMCDVKLMSHLKERAVPTSVIMPFSNALASMASERESSSILKAVEVRKAISQQFPQFSSSDQQDAHEFLLRCLDVIAKECSWTEFWESPTHTDYSLVQESNVKCVSCGHCSDPRRESLRGLSLDVPREVDGFESEPSVQDLIHRFFASQQVDLNCEHCKGKKATSDTKIVLAPRCLVLHIKRFGVEFDNDNGDVQLKKISDSVQIPDCISLDSVLAEDCLTLGSGRGPQPASESGTARKVTPTHIDDGTDLFSNPGSPNGRLSSPPPVEAAKISSPPPLKSQGFSQMTQLLSPKEEKGSSAKRPRGAAAASDFALRLRVHAEENEEQMRKRKKLSGEQPVCRTLQLDDDAIEEFGATQGGKASSTCIRHEELVKVVMHVGVRRGDAERIVKQSNYDRTRAIGLAMDRLQELKEKRIDLDEALVRYTWAQTGAKKDRLGPSERIGHKYKLAAVIRHESESMERGHYVVDVRQADGTWYCYDDSLVSKLGSRALQNEEGYLCWYMREEVQA